MLPNDSTRKLYIGDKGRGTIQISPPSPKRKTERPWKRKRKRKRRRRGRTDLSQ